MMMHYSKTKWFVKGLHTIVVDKSSFIEARLIKMSAECIKLRRTPEF